MSLPPCVRKMLQDYKSEYASLIAAYFKTYSGNADLAAVKIVREAGDVEVARHILAELSEAPRFECEVIKESYPDLCVPELCPLASNHNPVEMAKNLVERVIYVEDSDELVIIFRGGKSRMVTSYLGAMRNPRRFASDFRAKVLQVFRTDVDLRPYKDLDTGEVINPADEFLVWLISYAEQVVNYDTYGIGDLLLTMLAHEPVYAESEARHNPDARIIVKERAGKYYLYIDASYFRLRLRPLVGPDAMNARRANALLARYDIKVTRTSVGGEKKSVYIISNDVFERLTGKRIEEFLGVGAVDVDDLLAKVAGD